MGKLIYSLISIEDTSEESLTASLSAIAGISGAGLSAVCVNDISAVVSDVVKTGLISDRSVALEYSKVVETLEQQFTLLPVRYGSVVETIDSVIKLLENNYEAIHQNLQKVKNKQEFGLKVFCESDKLRTELKTNSDLSYRSPLKIQTNVNNSVYIDWMNAKLKEHRLEEQLLKYVDRVISDISNNLSELNAVNKFKKMASPTNIIDAVFLLGKDRKNDLIDAVKSLQNRYSSLQIILTGPWPPYNFVDFEMK